MTKDVEHFLKYLLAILDSSVENSLFRSVPHFYWGICSFDDQFFEFFVYFGDQTFDVGLVKIFSHSVGCCFVLLTVSFALQKLFSFRRSHLLTVSLSACAAGVIFRKWYSVPTCSSVFPTFSSIRFSVVGFMLRSLIHLYLSFVHAGRYWCILILLHVDIQLCQYHLLNVLSFFHLIFFCFFIKY